MIIALSGRKNTGKTTLANLLIKKGFTKISFATALKEYVSKLYNWNIEDLYSQIGKESVLTHAVYWNKDVCEKLEEIVGINLNYIENRKFSNRREALQYIGTEILRKADPDFHVKKFKEKFSSKDGYYVVDDLRFKNELDTLRGMDSICVHIIRPYNWVYSNHDSEISILRKDSECIIVNDKSQEEFVEKFESFINNDFDCQFLQDKFQNSDLNHDSFYEINEDSAYWLGVLMSAGKISKIEDRYFLEIESKNKNIIENFNDFLDIKNGEYARYSDNNIFYYSIVESKYIIEDLKLWDFAFENCEIPGCIENNDYLLSYWRKGVENEQIEDKTRRAVARNI